MLFSAQICHNAAEYPVHTGFRHDRCYQRRCLCPGPVRICPGAAVVGAELPLVARNACGLYGKDECVARLAFCIGRLCNDLKAIGIGTLGPCYFFLCVFFFPIGSVRFNGSGNFSALLSFF